MANSPGAGASAPHVAKLLHPAAPRPLLRQHEGLLRQGGHARLDLPLLLLVRPRELAHLLRGPLARLLRVLAHVLDLVPRLLRPEGHPRALLHARRHRAPPLLPAAAEAAHVPRHPLQGLVGVLTCLLDVCALLRRPEAHRGVAVDALHHGGLLLLPRLHAGSRQRLGPLPGLVGVLAQVLDLVPLLLCPEGHPLRIPRHPLGHRRLLLPEGAREVLHVLRHLVLRLLRVLARLLDAVPLVLGPHVHQWHLRDLLLHRGPLLLVLTRELPRVRRHLDARLVGVPPQLLHAIPLGPRAHAQGSVLVPPLDPLAHGLEFGLDPRAVLLGGLRGGPGAQLALLLHELEGGVVASLLHEVEAVEPKHALPVAGLRP
mmetsp:Transcript_27555/g.60631  ORF Transcript_27555/g.60631 Transcript_27555/m.60631 type:complete len:372 (-) Transcript_27555:64-1179(-)